MAKNIAVILSGCGHLDGAEIRESVLTLLELDRQGATVQIFAPNQAAHHNVNHLTGKEEGEARNILVEAARLARGKIAPLSELNPTLFDALIMPGGFGAAKNLSSFAFDGPAGRVLLSVQSTIEAFAAAGKPIGAICIAPAVVGLALKSKGIKVTVGNDEATASALTSMGIVHQNCAADEIAYDEANKIISTPAYMYDEAPLAQIAVGIAKCVEKVIALA